MDSPNVPAMSAGEVVDALKGLLARSVRAGADLRSQPSVMLWGPPGVGKSQAVRQVASELEAATGKRVVVTDIRLLLYSPVDLRGIPVANDDKTLAVWLRPKVFDLDPGDDVINIVLLDELSAAPPSVQAAAYQLVLEGAVGEHQLPGNCSIIAAGNRLSDRGVAYRMPKPLANRMLHIEVRPDFPSWREWAVRSGVNDKVVAYLAFRPDRLMAFDASSEDLAFASPRSWAMAGEVLDGCGGDVEQAFPLVCGLVGVGAASEFRTWSRVYGQLPNMDDVFGGTARRVPKGADALYALTSAMTAHARAHLDDRVAIEHSIAYAQKLPPDFSVMLLKDYLALVPGHRERLMRIPRFAKWVAQNGRLLNGTV
ncbi:MAG: MoxR family ATPase [Coriobacteriaceae bacterium]|nr:MoxR family ATPase [Coriobacteriaceae bacterium]